MFVLQGCFVFSLVKYKPLTYNKVYEYPDWAIGLGWCLALSSMICIPMVMVIKILQSEGPLIEVSDAVKSTKPIMFFSELGQKVRTLGSEHNYLKEMTQHVLDAVISENFMNVLDHK